MQKKTYSFDLSKLFIGLITPKSINQSVTHGHPMLYTVEVGISTVDIVIGIAV